MLTREERLRRRLVGGAVILAGILIVLIAVLRPAPFEATQSIWVDFDSVQGLGDIDRDVRVGGVNVGRVGAVQREGDNARVELVLDDSVTVHSDARAALRPHTLFEGTAFVDLSPGSPSAPPLGDGDTIPLEASTVYISLDQALRVLNEPNRLGVKSILRTGARTFRDEAISGLPRTLHDSPQLVADLGPSARALTGPQGIELGRAVRNLSNTVDDVAAEADQIGPLTRRANRTLSALEVNDGAPLDRALRGLPGALEELQRGGPGLARVVDRLGTIAHNARPALPDLTDSLHGADPLLRRLPPILERTRPMVTDLRLLFERTSAAAPDLSTLTKGLTDASLTLGGSVLPAISAPTKLGQPGYVQLLSTLAAASGATRPFQTAAQGLAGTGHLIRLGAYFDPAGLGSIGISCELIATFSPTAAAQLEAQGFCTP